MGTEALYVCDGPACRMRARDLELAVDGARHLPCVGRCDAPVAAFTVAAEQPRVLLRELTLERRGHDPQLARPPGAQRGPHEPIRLRDLLMSDQPELDMARRRGAYRGLESPVELGQLVPGVWPEGARAPLVIVDGGGDGPGQFGLRPICERDPHVIVAGMLIAARSARAARVVFQLRQPWIEARRALERAIAAAVAAGLTEDITLEIVGHDARSPVAEPPRPPARIDDARVANAATNAGANAATNAAAANAPTGDALAITAAPIVTLPHILARGAAWWAAHSTRLCAVSGDVLRPGVYELDAHASIADVISAAGGVVDGVRTSTPSSFLADGAILTPSHANDPAPDGLIVAHARRDRFQL